MSIRSLFTPNQYEVYAGKITADEINGIEGNTITGSNTNGQVLTITDAALKQVAFVDPQGGTPPTLGEPDGYVLAIKDNTTGELEWRQDATGSIPDPLVLSGTNNVNKFQVRNASNSPKFTVDTVNSKVLLSEALLESEFTGFPIVQIGASVNGIRANNAGGSPYAELNYAQENLTLKGTDKPNKFLVQNLATDVKFNVDTTSDEISLQALNNRIEGADSSNKLAVFNSGDAVNADFKVSTSTGETSIYKNLLLNGLDDRDKFLIKKSTNETIFNVSTDGGEVAVKRTDSASKFTVYDSVDVPVFRVDSQNKEVRLGNPISNQRMSFEIPEGNFLIKTDSTAENGIQIENTSMTSQFIFSLDPTFSRANIIADKPLVLQAVDYDFKASGVNIDAFKFDQSRVNQNATISNYTTPQTIPQLGGLPTTLLQKMEYDAGGAGDSNLVGYSAQNGPSSIFLLNSNVGAGLYMINPNSGINSSGNLEITTGGTTGDLTISKGVPNTTGQVILRRKAGTSEMIFNSSDNCTLVANTTTIDSSSGNLNLLGDTVVLSGSVANFDLDVAFLSGYNVEYFNAPTTDESITNKLYVDTHVRTLSNITTYVNALGGTLPSVTTAMSQTLWNQITWTGALLITSTPLDFSVVSPGVLQYDGTATRWFSIILEICCELDNADQMVQYVALDNSNVPINDSFGCFFTKDATLKNGGTCTTNARQLSTGDQIKYGFRTPRATNNLTLLGYKIQILEN